MVKVKLRITRLSGMLYAMMYKHNHCKMGYLFTIDDNGIKSRGLYV